MVKFNTEDIAKPKLKAINDAARNLLFKFGIRKLTVEDICRESSVSKMTFYKFFDNKLDIALYLLHGMMEESFTAYRGIMDQDMSFEQKVERIIHLKMNYAGLLSQEFLEDIIENGGPEITAMLQEQAIRSIKMMLDDFSVAQEKGLIRADLNLQFVVYFMNHMNEIMKDPKFTVLYTNPADMVSELINFFFYGILPRPGHH